MKRITVDGITGVALWGDEDPVIAFRPDGEDEWSYIPRTVLRTGTTKPGEDA